MPDPERDAAIDTVQRELIAFARRARTRAAQLHPELSLVSYSMLDLMRERDGCRSADLAAHFMLDKSTVSRQVASLESLGFIERQADPADHRGQILNLSDEGVRVLDEAAQRRRESFVGRFADWSIEDIDRFADYVRRYNEAG